MRVIYDSELFFITLFGTRLQSHIGNENGIYICIYMYIYLKIAIREKYHFQKCSKA